MDRMSPIDVATHDAIAYLLSALPPPPARILEVGCGDGSLAVALQGHDYEVIALDKSPEAIAAAREAGAQAVEADFLEFESEPFDVLLFTRSLHHIYPLEDAVARAHTLLKLDGLLILDEFAREAANRDTAGWFFAMRSLLEAAGILHIDHDHAVATDPLEAWRALYAHDEHHPLHTGEAMVDAVARHFDVHSRNAVPYLYRSLSQWLEQTERGYRVAETLLQMEREWIDRGVLVAVGFRLVARKV